MCDLLYAHRVVAAFNFLIRIPSGPVAEDDAENRRALNGGGDETLRVT